MCAPSDIFLGLLAILFPPLPVWIKTGICSGASLLNILLLILGYLPGLLHAWYIISAMPEGASTAYYYEEIDAEAGHGRHTRIPGPNGVGAAHGGPGAGAGANASAGYVAPPPQLGPGAGYGTVAAPAGPSSGQQQPEGLPPTYDQAVKGDNKVQK